MASTRGGFTGPLRLGCVRRGTAVGVSLGFGGFFFVRALRQRALRLTKKRPSKRRALRWGFYEPKQSQLTKKGQNSRMGKGCGSFFSNRGLASRGAMVASLRSARPGLAACFVRRLTRRVWRCGMNSLPGVYLPASRPKSTFGPRRFRPAKAKLRADVESKRYDAALRLSYLSNIGRFSTSLRYREA